jgi:hypothetical protein
MVTIFVIVYFLGVFYFFWELGPSNDQMSLTGILLAASVWPIMLPRMMWKELKHWWRNRGHVTGEIDAEFEVHEDDENERDKKP